MLPSSFFSSDLRKVFWKCAKGHIWSASIVNRVHNNTGCPYCAGQKVWSGYNDLATIKPDLAKEWNCEKNGSLTVNSVTCGSTRKVWWICSKGHNWCASIANRARGTGCPYCSNRKVLKGYNDLASLKPDLVKEWDYAKNVLKPDELVCSSNKKVGWKCKKGHEWKATVANRVIVGTGCPYCKGIGHSNDLVIKRPELVKEWDYEKNKDLTPEMFTYGSCRKVWWKCEQGHEWEAKVAARTSGNNCPYCSGKRVLRGYNDLATVRPDLAKEWNYKRNEALKPEMFTPNSNKKVWWICKEGHEWYTKIEGRNVGRSCPYCVKKYYRNRMVYNFRINHIIKEYYKCECQKCKYTNILTLDEMKKHYEECSK